MAHITLTRQGRGDNPSAPMTAALPPRYFHRNDICRERKGRDGPNEWKFGQDRTEGAFPVG